MSAQIWDQEALNELSGQDPQPDDLLCSVVQSSATAPPAPVKGQIYFDGTHWLGWTGTAWQQFNMTA